MKIGIVGGSLAGCSAAILLERAGHDVTVFERTRGALRGRGGGIATPTPVFDSLVEADIIDADMPQLLCSEAPFIGKRDADDRVGHTAWELPMSFRSFHWSALWQQLRKRVPDARYVAGARVVDFRSDERAHLRFEDGSEQDFDLVLFADGYASLGRRLLLPDVELRYRGYMLWRGLLPEAEVPNAERLEGKMPRITYRGIPGTTVLYFIPGHDGATTPGQRLMNWAAYIPLPEEELGSFMVDRHGKLRSGTVPPGEMRLEEEARLKALMSEHLPGDFGDILASSNDTYVQLIYTSDLPAYRKGPAGFIGDAGAVVQPHTGSGVFKGYNNVLDLLAAFEANPTVDAALDAWSLDQVARARRLLAFGEQTEKAFILEPLDFATTDAETAAAWWKASVTFPDDFDYGAAADD